jgi:hypothetical protein
LLHEACQTRAFSKRKALERASQQAPCSHDKGEEGETAELAAV